MRKFLTPLDPLWDLLKSIIYLYSHKITKTLSNDFVITVNDTPKNMFQDHKMVFGISFEKFQFEAPGKSVRPSQNTPKKFFPVHKKYLKNCLPSQTIPAYPKDDSCKFLE